MIANRGIPRRDNEIVRKWREKPKTRNGIRYTSRNEGREHLQLRIQTTGIPIRACYSQPFRAWAGLRIQYLGESVIKLPTMAAQKKVTSKSSL